MTTGSPHLRVIDLETTGDSFTNGSVVEVGWQDLTQDADGRWAVHGSPAARFVQPGNQMRMPYASNSDH